jgi:hypothetical protein
VQAHRFGHGGTEPAGEPRRAEFFVPGVDAQRFGGIARVVDELPDVVQERRDDHGVGFARLHRQVPALQDMLDLGYVLAIAGRPERFDQVPDLGETGLPRGSPVDRGACFFGFDCDRLTTASIRFIMHSVGAGQEARRVHLKRGMTGK